MTEFTRNAEKELSINEEAINYIKDRVANNDYAMSEFHSWFTSQPQYIEAFNHYNDDCFQDFYIETSDRLIDDELELFSELYENKAGFFEVHNPFAYVFFRAQDIGIKFPEQTKYYFSLEDEQMKMMGIEDGAYNYINQIMDSENPKCAQVLSSVVSYNKIHKIRAELMKMYLEDSELDGFTEAFTAIAEREKESTHQEPDFYITYSVDLHYGRIYSNYIKTEQEMAEWFSANFDVGFKGFSIGEIDGFKYLKSKKTDKLFYFKYENSYLTDKCLEELNSHYLKYENGAEDTTRYSIVPIFENDTGKTLFSFK